MSFTITFNEAQLAIVSEALSELPFKKSAPVLGAIQLQIRAAQSQAAEAAKSAEAPVEAEVKAPAPAKTK